MRQTTLLVAFVLFVAGVQSHLCYATGDPHNRNFRGQRYENQWQGDFTIFEKRSLKFRCDARQRFWNRQKTVTVNTRVACQAGPSNVQIHHWNHVTVNGKRVGRGNRRLKGGAYLQYHGRDVNLHYRGIRIRVQSNHGHRHGNLPRVYQNIWVWTGNYHGMRGMCVGKYDSRKRHGKRRPPLYSNSPLRGKKPKKRAAHHAKVTRQALKRAKWVCKDKGLTGQAFHNCVFDVAVSHKARFARGAKRFVQMINRNYRRKCHHNICHYQRRVRYRKAYKKRISTRVLKTICRHNVAYKKKIRYRKRLVKKWVTYYWRTIPDYRRRNHFKRVAVNRLQHLKKTSKQASYYSKEYQKYQKLSHLQRQKAKQYKRRFHHFMARFRHFQRIARHRLHKMRHFKRKVHQFKRQYHRYKHLAKSVTKRIRTPKVHKRVHYVWAHKYVTRYRWETKRHFANRVKVVTRHKWAHKWVHHKIAAQKGGNNRRRRRSVKRKTVRRKITFRLHHLGHRSFHVRTQHHKAQFFRYQWRKPMIFRIRGYDLYLTFCQNPRPGAACYFFILNGWGNTRSWFGRGRIDAKQGRVHAWHKWNFHHTPRIHGTQWYWVRFAGRRFQAGRGHHPGHHYVMNAHLHHYFHVNAVSFSRYHRVRVTVYNVRQISNNGCHGRRHVRHVNVWEGHRITLHGRCIHILWARYGRHHRWRNVKGRLQHWVNRHGRKHLHNRGLHMNGLFGDPWHGMRKILQVRYSFHA